jgi:hypothetical protein
MRRLTSADLPSSTLRSLERAKIAYVSDILDTVGYSIQQFSAADPSTVVERFCEQCEDLSRFGQKSKQHLAAFLDANKRAILDHYFMEIHKLRCAEIAEEDDFIPDLGSTVPTETLLIAVHISKGDVDVANIEDVISEIESAVREAMLEFSEDSPSESEVREQVSEVLALDEWPADRPIYVSAEAAKVYPEIVVALSKKAQLTLRGQ